MRVPFFGIVTFLLVTIFATGCGLLLNKKPRTTPPAGWEPTPEATKHRSGSGEAAVATVEFTFETGVTSDYKAAIEKDLEILANAGLTESADADVIDLSSFHNQNLHDWLSQRVKIVVGEGFSDTSYVEKYGVTYPADALQRVGATTMSNVGAGVYANGRKSQNLRYLYVDGKKVVIDTPRVGIVKIGSAFLNGRKVPNSSYLDDVNSYFRLCTLFHEGRHSDGRSDHVGMLHALCESGDYYGDYACDEYTNGPYTVAKVLLTKFRAICTHCTSTEKSTMDLYIADNASRVLGRAIRANSQPERVGY